MFKEKIKLLAEKVGKPTEGNNKKKIENLVVFILLLIIVLVVINVIWSGDKKEGSKSQTVDPNKKLATQMEADDNQKEQTTSQDEMTNNLEAILSKMDGVGAVKVLISYSQTSQTVPLYNEDSSEKDTQENDKQGGNRKITEASTKKEVIYKEVNGEKIPITQSIISPKIEGAIITAEGAGDINVKANIIQAVEAVTGVSTYKIQVFEMRKN